MSTAAAAPAPTDGEEEVVIVGTLTEKEIEKLINEIDYPMHPLAAAMPAMSPQDFHDLDQSIRKLGVQDEIELARTATGEWAVLDGNSRLRSCVGIIRQGIDKAENGNPIKPTFFKHDSKDQEHLLDVVKARSTRRNLKPIQRAATVVRMDAMRRKLQREAGTEVREKYADRWNRLVKESGCNADHVQACMRAAKVARDADLLDKISEGVMNAVTARQIMDRRDASLPDVETPEEKAKRQKAKNGGEEVQDEDGLEVPEYLLATFTTAIEMENFRKELSRSIKKKYAALAASPGGEGLQINVMADAVKNVNDHIRHMMPRVVCPKAKKKTPCPDTCPTCRGYSFLTRRREEEIQAEKEGRTLDDAGDATGGDAEKADAKSE